MLLGRIPPDQPGVFEVEAFEEIACEHRRGPSYALSPEDHERLAEAAGRQRPESDPQVIGFFRSVCQRDAMLDSQDKDLIREYLSEEGLFLLLVPKSPFESEAAFVFVRDGEAQNERPASLFKFDPVTLAVPEPEAPPPVASPAAETGPIAAIPVAPPSPVNVPAFNLPPARRRMMPRDDPSGPATRTRFWLPLLASIALGIGAAVLYEIWQTPRELRTANLKLDATQSGGEVRLYWDRQSRAVAGARQGNILVSDGGEQRRIQLTPADIRSGEFSYHPSHSDLLFRLELSGGGADAETDSLRILGATVARPAPTAPPPPAIAPARTLDASRSAPPDNNPPPASPPAQNTAAESTPQTTPPSDGTSDQGTQPGTQPVAAGSAVALREVHPLIPEGIRSRIDSRIVIPVDVLISPEGSVVGAVARGTATGDGVYRYLADEAVRAARLWRFSPARSANGTALLSKRTVEFVFEPDGQPGQDH